MEHTIVNVIIVFCGNKFNVEVIKQITNRREISLLVGVIKEICFYINEDIGIKLRTNILEQRNDYCFSFMFISQFKERATNLRDFISVVFAVIIH